MTNQDSRRPAERSMFGRILRLIRKELRETLRDRRTVITLVLMPLLVYPLLSISFNKSLLLTSGQATEQAFLIGVESEAHSALLEKLLGAGESVLLEKKKELQKRADDARPTPGSSPMEIEGEEVELHWSDGASLESSVADLRVHAAVRIRQETQPKDQSSIGPVQCELLFREDSPTSERAMRFVEERLQALNEATLRTRLVQLRRSPTLPAQVVFKPVMTETGMPFSLSTLVPLVLILMTITGSVYPAIDLTAGERERGTLETLIAAPISRMALLVAKYAAVLIVAVLTAMVNLVAMTVTLLTSSLGQQLFPEGLSPVLMIEIFGLMILFATFFSAIVLAVTSFARSFKEAQAYLIPLMLLAISPGLLSLMPGIELSGALAVAPLVNIVLLSRDILEGTVDPAMAAVAIVSTVIYAVAAISIASKIFGNDALLYASRGSWSELFQRPSTPQPAATPSATLACLVTLFPCYFVLGNLANIVGPEPTTTQLMLQLVLNIFVVLAIFAFLPLLFARMQRVTLRSGFQLHGASWFAFGGAVLLGMTLWPFAYELYKVGEWAGLVSVDTSRFDELNSRLTLFQEIPLVVRLASLAIVPAAVEEFFFRGYLFQGLRTRFRGPTIIAVTAVLFGLFHVLSPNALMPERFLPSTFLGFVLGWVCYRTGSILPGLLLHACHNGLMLWLMQNQEMLKKLGWDPEQSAHFPLTWLLGFAVTTAFAGTVLYFATRTSSHANE